MFKRLKEWYTKRQQKKKEFSRPLKVGEVVEIRGLCFQVQRRSKREAWLKSIDPRFKGTYVNAYFKIGMSLDDLFNSTMFFKGSEKRKDVSIREGYKNGTYR